MTPQRCEAGVHNDWASDCPDSHGCPWCEINRLSALVESQRKLLTARRTEPARPCTHQSAHGIECELADGHDGVHRRHGDGVTWTWGPA